VLEQLQDEGNRALLTLLALLGASALPARQAHGGRSQCPGHPTSGRAGAHAAWRAGVRAGPSAVSWQVRDER